MSGYHVACGVSNIYAGTVRGGRWHNKSDVTDEAIAAVAFHIANRLGGETLTQPYGDTYKIMVEKVVSECCS